MGNPRWDIIGKLALGLCLASVVLGVVVGILAATSPRTWTMMDARNSLIAGEVGAAFLGALARKSHYGSSAMIIGGVLALGAYLFAPTR